MKRKKKGVSYAKYGYIFSIPFVVIFLIFSLYPIIYTAVIGFTDLKGLGRTDINFLDDPFLNFKAIFKNPSFQKSLSNTAIIWTFNFIPQILIALLLTAWFTNRRNKMKGQGVFKILFYMPNIITAATIAILFNALFAYPKGPVNDLLMMLGISEKPIEFLRDKWTARNIVSFIQFWMWYGHTMIILIAGVTGIDPTIFESAEIDGASSAQTFFHITLPVTSMLGGLQMFDIPKLFLNGGPDNATLTTSVFIYNQAFSGSYMYNRAAAASMVMFVIATILSGLFFFALRDKDEAQLKKEQKKALKVKKVKGGGQWHEI